MTFVVVGIFKTGLYEFDAKYALIQLQEAQKFFGLGDGITGIEVKLDDMWQIGPVGRAIRAQLTPPLFAKDWQEMNRSLFSAIKIEKLVMFLMLCIIVFVAALNIFSNLYMVVMDKKKSIAMLRAMGASARRIRQIVLAQGMTIGILGSAIGAALGVGICLLQMRYGLIKLDPYVYYIDTLPITLKAFDLAAVILSSLGLCLAATWVPARIAARLDAVEVLRYE
jgi:lipoprotein-releasing system permease protein